uniref:Retrotransposable element Tf2 n=1 Tax=Cajanus cajan TaxID=3821 RepID=A0A151RNK0_CAJCA|nr:Retrotransposable element Tf2 [Cajanus cajan]
MKFQGFVNGITVQVLLDSGSSDSFLQPRIAHCLKLPIEPIPNFQVLVGNGNALVAERLVKNIEVRIQGHSLTFPVYLLPVTGADLVLGAAWLATLGPHISDYSNLTLKFYLGNQFVTLHGKQPTLPLQAQYNHMRRMNHTHAIAELFTLQFQQVVFSIPYGLPPSRSQNHSIPLLQGSEPVKVRPYRSLHMSTSYHPQSDGQSESLNKCLEMYLRCFTYDSPKDWARLLPWAEYWYNTSYHHSSGMTPFKIVYGRDPPTLVKYTLNQSDPTSIQEQLLQRDLTLSRLKFNLHKAQQYMKKHADKKRKSMELQIGDMVFVKLQPYRQHFVALRKNQKLSMRFFGPFPVIQRIGQVAYKLLLPPTTRIHLVFHCSQLKPCKGDHSQPYVPLPINNTDLQLVI